MKRTNLPGHALRGEGKAHAPGEEAPWLRIRGHIGRALCECGAVSDVEWTDAARKRWHAAHKDEIRRCPVCNPANPGWVTSVDYDGSGYEQACPACKAEAETFGALYPTGTLIVGLSIPTPGTDDESDG